METPAQTHSDTSRTDALPSARTLMEAAHAAAREANALRSQARRLDDALEPFSPILAQTHQTPADAPGGVPSMSGWLGQARKTFDTDSAVAISNLERLSNQLYRFAREAEKRERMAATHGE